MTVERVASADFDEADILGYRGIDEPRSRGRRSGSLRLAHLATICITTFRKPLGLTRLLEAIRDLEVPEGWEFDVVVVDNDPAGTARAAIEQVANLEVRYLVELVRGVSHARNRAIRETRGASWVAFLDDDEWPDPQWLRRLVDVQVETGADVVIGPSVPTFELDPPVWIREGRFFERTRPPTGTPVPFWLERTTGVLIRRTCFDALGEEPFDGRYALAGGEDVYFFETAQRRGAMIVWVDDAIVHEFVPATRSNARWVLLRSFRTGNSRSLTLLLEGGGRARRSERALRGAVDIGFGIALLVMARDKAHGMVGIARSALGLGLVAGAIGIRYDEYTVTHRREDRLRYRPQVVASDRPRAADATRGRRTD